SYRDWAGGEPNNFNGEEYWTELVLTTSSTVPSGTWNDIYNDANPVHSPNSYGPVFGLVEVVPEPVLLPLFAALTLLPLRVRRLEKGTLKAGRARRLHFGFSAASKSCRVIASIGSL